MNKILLSLCFMCFAVLVSAQSKQSVKLAEAATAELTSQYQLDEAQQKTMLEIQTRKYNNIELLEEIKTTQPELYVRKREANVKNTDASIKRLLNEQQLVTFNQILTERRKERLATVKSLSANGASKEEIQNALLEIE